MWNIVKEKTFVKKILKHVDEKYVLLLNLDVYKYERKK